MSVSAALQKLVLDTLTADLGVAYVVGDRIYDRARPNATFPFISFGPTSVVLVQDDCLEGRTETLQIDIWSTDQAGMLQAKQICDLVIKALNGLEAELEDGYATDIRVVLSQVITDPDGITSHGVIQIEALIDEGGV
jgi:Protein of unknown function (DUF3168)